MSVYSNTEIKEAIKNGTIVSVPYEPGHVSEASLDFTLGYYFYKFVWYKILLQAKKNRCILLGVESK